jgi:hypothetical protein
LVYASVVLGGTFPTQRFYIGRRHLIGTWCGEGGVEPFTPVVDVRIGYFGNSNFVDVSHADAIDPVWL